MVGRTFNRLTVLRRGRDKVSPGTTLLRNGLPSFVYLGSGFTWAVLILLKKQPRHTTQPHEVFTGNSHALGAPAEEPL